MAVQRATDISPQFADVGHEGRRIVIEDGARAVVSEFGVVLFRGGGDDECFRVVEAGLLDGVDACVSSGGVD